MSLIRWSVLSVRYILCRYLKCISLLLWLILIADTSHIYTKVSMSYSLHYYNLYITKCFDFSFFTCRLIKGTGEVLLYIYKPLKWAPEVVLVLATAHLSERFIIMPVYASLPLSKTPGSLLCRGGDRAGQSESGRD